VRPPFPLKTKTNRQSSDEKFCFVFDTNCVLPTTLNTGNNKLTFLNRRLGDDMTVNRRRVSAWRIQKISDGIACQESKRARTLYKPPTFLSLLLSSAKASPRVTKKKPRKHACVRPSFFPPKRTTKYIDEKSQSGCGMTCSSRELRKMRSKN
jgi:hypothetical protein